PFLPGSGPLCHSASPKGRSPRGFPAGPDLLRPAGVQLGILGGGTIGGATANLALSRALPDRCSLGLLRRDDEAPLPHIVPRTSLRGARGGLRGARRRIDGVLDRRAPGAADGPRRAGDGHLARLLPRDARNGSRRPAQAPFAPA